MFELLVFFVAHGTLFCHCRGHSGAEAAIQVYRFPTCKYTRWLRSCGDLSFRVSEAGRGVALSMHTVTRIALPVSDEGTARKVHLLPGGMLGWSSRDLVVFCTPPSPFFFSRREDHFFFLSTSPGWGKQKYPPRPL